MEGSGHFPPMPEAKEVLAIVCPMCADTFVDIKDKLEGRWHHHVLWRHPALYGQNRNYGGQAVTQCDITFHDISWDQWSYGNGGPTSNRDIGEDDIAAEEQKIISEVQAGGGSAMNAFANEAALRQSAISRLTYERGIPK